MTIKLDEKLRRQVNEALKQGKPVIITTSDRVRVESKVEPLIIKLKRERP